MKKERQKERKNSEIYPNLYFVFTEVFTQSFNARLRSAVGVSTRDAFSHLICANQYENFITPHENITVNLMIYVEDNPENFRISTFQSH